MKLTQVQVNALANKIYKELNPKPIKTITEINKIRIEEELKAIKDFRKTEEGKLLKKAYDIFKSNNISDAYYIESGIVKLGKSKTKYSIAHNTQTKYPLHDIANTIILATIDSTNLDDLITSVKASLTQ